MKNILSYGCGAVFSGKEIKTWIKENLHTSKAKVAKYLLRYLTLKDDKKYVLAKELYRSTSNYNKYIFISQHK